MEDWQAVVLNWKFGVGLGAAWFFFRRVRNRQHYHHLCEYEYGQYKNVPDWLPSINGRTLDFLAWICNTQVGDLLINKIIITVVGVPKFRTLELTEGPTFFPFAPHNLPVASLREPVDISGLEKAHKELSHVPNEFRYRRAFEYVQAYRNSQLTPLDVAERVIETIKRTNPNLKMLCDWHPEMILEQARESTERYISGKILSPLDGTFCVVKDQISVAGHCNRSGLSFINKIEDGDAPLVTKVRDAGIIIVGISNMTELGMSVFGANPSSYHGTCRNPINTDYYPGGSSSGTAAAICSGLVPFGIGTDGGGSIRMPSCQTGIVGLKTTFSRVSANSYAKAKTCCSTVANIGPMASNIIDLALFYQVLAGPIRGDAFSMAQPKVKVPKELTPYLDGIKIGVDWKWAELSRPEVFVNFKKKIEYLAERGARIIGVDIPELDFINTGHLISIVSENSEAIGEALNKQRKIAPDNAVILNAGLSCLMASDFTLAAKYRTRLMAYLKGLFKTIDVLANPTCAQTAERILDGDENGSWKFGATLRYMMYVKLSNYSGIPSMSVPSGFAPNGLPTGIMLQGNWYSEELLIKIGHVLDIDHKRVQPEVFTDLLL